MKPSVNQFSRNPKPVARQQKKGLEIAYIVGLAIILVIPVLWIASKQSSLINIGYRISEIRDENALLKQEQARLRAELAGLTRPDQLLGKIVDLGLTPVAAGNRYEVHIENLPEPTLTTDSALTGVHMEP